MSEDHDELATVRPRLGELDAPNFLGWLRHRLGLLATKHDLEQLRAHIDMKTAELKTILADVKDTIDAAVARNGTSDIPAEVADLATQLQTSAAALKAQGNPAAGGGDAPPPV